jgi:RNA-directed DNA polymerase
LLHQAEVNLMDETDTRTTDSGQLLERVAWLPNLARALLKVASNKGAPGVDGESVQSAVEHAPQLLADLHLALIEGTYIPGDIRRVWIPKPGGGERG